MPFKFNVSISTFWNGSLAELSFSSLVYKTSINLPNASLTLVMVKGIYFMSNTCLWVATNAAIKDTPANDRTEVKEKLSPEEYIPTLLPSLMLEVSGQDLIKGCLMQ